jgi:hypothetical protein
MIVQSVAQEADARLLPAPQQCLQAEFEVGQCLLLIRPVLEIDQVAGLLLMDPDDPRRSGIIKPPRPGQGGCGSSSWCPVTATPSRICAVNQPT